MAAAAAAEDVDPSSSTEETPCIVLDSGSGCLRAGFAGDDRPLVEAPSLIGRQGTGAHGAPREVLIGAEALNAGPVPQLALTHPVQRGVVVDWHDAELLWRRAIESGLGADPAHHPILLAESPLNPKANREAALQLLFEGFNAPAAYVANASALALYASGRGSGVLLSCGEGVSSAEVIYEGYALPASTRRLDRAGADVTDAVRDLLRRRGCCLETPAEWQLARQLKERHFRVRESPRPEDSVVKEADEAEYQLPDGRGIVRLSRRDLSSPFDALFGPASACLQRLVLDAVSAADIDIRRDLWSNVLLSGGSTLAAGFPERLRVELLAAVLPTSAYRVRVVASPERDRAVWVGGSILASLSTFQRMWISRRDYDEWGPHVGHRMCY